MRLDGLDEVPWQQLDVGVPGHEAADLARCTVLDHPGNHRFVAWAVRRLGGDRDMPLRAIGDAVRADEPAATGSVRRLADFGSAAAPCADRVRHLMDVTEGWGRSGAAVALWAITGESAPVLPVLEEVLQARADGGELYYLLREALETLGRIGRTTPSARAALLLALPLLTGDGARGD